MTKEHTGLLLGLTGVLLFSGTLPATRIAVQTLDPMLVGFGRSVLAAHLAAIVLIVTRQPFPRGAVWKWLAITAAGVIFGFPALTSWAMRYVPASHGAVVVGLLPLTAAAALQTDFTAVPWSAWAGLFYVAVFSQYLGFFAWYGGLDLGGVARVSQVQLLQVFFTFTISALLVGETISLMMLLFAVAVVAVVALGRRAPVASLVAAPVAAPVTTPTTTPPASR